MSSTLRYARLTVGSCVSSRSLGALFLLVAAVPLPKLQHHKGGQSKIPYGRKAVRRDKDFLQASRQKRNYRTHTTIRCRSSHQRSFALWSEGILKPCLFFLSLSTLCGTQVVDINVTHSPDTKDRGQETGDKVGPDSTSLSICFMRSLFSLRALHMPQWDFFIGTVRDECPASVVRDMGRQNKHYSKGTPVTNRLWARCGGPGGTWTCGHSGGTMKSHSKKEQHRDRKYLGT